MSTEEALQQFPDLTNYDRPHIPHYNNSSAYRDPILGLYTYNLEGIKGLLLENGESIDFKDFSKTLEFLGKYPRIVVFGSKRERRSRPFLRNIPYVTSLYLQALNKVENIGFYGDNVFYQVLSKDKRKRTYLEDLGAFFQLKETVQDFETANILYCKLTTSLLHANVPIDSLSYIGSPARAFEKLLVPQAIGALPDIRKIPESLLHLAWNCFKGCPWVAEELGYKEIFSGIDQNGSFSASVGELVDISACDWIESNEYQTDAFYGFLECEGTIQGNGISPVVVRSDSFDGLSSVLSGGKNINGSFSRLFLTKQDYDLIKATETGNIKIIRGWWGIPEVYYYPFKETVESLYELRQSSGSVIYKMLNTPGWGKFAQARKVINASATDYEWSIGRLFNPIYAATIPAITRQRIFSIAFRLQPGVRALRLDAVWSRDNFSEEITGSLLGEFKLQSRTNIVYLNPILNYTKEKFEEIIFNDGRLKTVGLAGLGVGVTLKDTSIIGKYRTTQKRITPSANGRELPEGLTLKDLLNGGIPTRLKDRMEVTMDEKRFERDVREGLGDEL